MYFLCCISVAQSFLDIFTLHTNDTLGLPPTRQADDPLRALRSHRSANLGAGRGLGAFET